MDALRFDGQQAARHESPRFSRRGRANYRSTLLRKGLMDDRRSRQCPRWAQRPRRVAAAGAATAESMSLARHEAHTKVRQKSSIDTCGLSALHVRAHGCGRASLAARAADPRARLPRAGGRRTARPSRLRHAPFATCNVQSRNRRLCLENRLLGKGEKSLVRRGRVRPCHQLVARADVTARSLRPAHACGATRSPCMHALGLRTE